MFSMLCLRRFSIAPMLKLTDRHCRYFHRQLSKHTLLYTEMVTTRAILNSKGDYLSYNQEEHPIALQLAGNTPTELAKCAKLAELHGYDEINFNVGCPSDHVQKNKFGVCMMVNPALVSDCVKAMLDVVNIPVTVKTRIGFDNQDSYEFLCNFISIVSNLSGCDTFIIHARKAYLSRLTPQKNRAIPSLDYLRVYQLKRDFMALTIVINGGIKTLTEAKLHLQHVDGVMIGRAVYYNPSILSQVDHELFGYDTLILTPIEVIRSMYPYIEKELAKGAHLGHITRHILGLVKGIPGARKFRRYLSENMYKPGANIKMLETALMILYG